MVNLKTFSCLAFLIIVARIASIAQCSPPNGNSQSGCAGSYTLSATSMNSAVTQHKWYTAASGGSGIATTNQFSPTTGVWVSQLTVTLNATTTYYVASVCGGTETTARNPVTFTYTPGASISITPSSSPLSVCVGSSFTLTASGGSSYSWYLGNPSSGGIFLSSSTVLSPTQTGTYYLTGVNGCGVSQSTSIPVTIVTTPSAPIASNIVIHYNTYATLTASGALSGETYKWYGATGNYLGMGTTYTTSTRLTQNANYSVSKYSSCEGPKVSFQVIVNQPPVVDAGPDQSTELSSISLYGSATDPEGTNQSYAWTVVSGPPSSSFGTAGASATSVNGLTVGTYVFRLSVTDAGGDTGTDDVTVTVTGSGNNYNYTREESVNVPAVTTAAGVSALAIGAKIQTTSYTNGLGKTIQSVGTQQSAQKRDVILPVSYDGLGRQAKSYLPIASSVQTTGNFVSQILSNDPADPYNETKYPNSPHQQFYQNFNDGVDKIANSIAPYSQTVFENSSLSRPRLLCEPGEVYTGTNDASMDNSVYGSNATNELRRWTVGSNNLPTSAGAYDVGTLRTTIKTNEEGISTEIFYNAKGIKLAEKQKTSSSTSGWAETYYVYDDYENLRFLLSPEFIKIYPTGSGSKTPTQTDVNKWCYQFNYDFQNRLIEEKSPGVDWSYSIYDSRGRIVLSQDGNQRVNNEWTYLKYDEFNRPVLYGVYRPGSSISRASMQTTIDNLAGGAGYQNVVNNVTTAPRNDIDIVLSAYAGINTYNAVHSIALEPGFSFKAGTTGTVFDAAIYTSTGTGSGTPSDVFPIANDEPLIKLYYDNYQNCEICQDANFQFVAPSWGTTQTGAAITSNDPNAFIPAVNVNTKTVATSTKILGTTNWLNEVIYYNASGNAIQRITSNHLGGYDKKSILYDFSGTAIASLETMTGYNSGNINSIRKRFVYDHAGRPLTTYHRINNQPEIITTSLEYNELGQLVKRKIHGVGPTPTYLQAIDYRYGIQNTLLSINGAAADSGDPTPDYFGLGLAYETSIAGNTPRKDGLISGMEWSQDISAKQHLYNFIYTDRGQLKDSKYKMSTDNGATWNAATDYFNEEGLQYDLNGNITALNRNTEFFNGTSLGADQIDKLTYDYSVNGGNLLSNVMENSTSSNKGLGFKDGANTITDYQYDNNGNVVADNNKGISISYYINNLVNRITMSDGSYIQYTYAANGKRCSQAYYNATLAQTVTTDFINGMVLLNGQVLSINTEFGRIVAPTYSNLASNKDAGSLDGFTTNGTVSLATQYLNTQTYVTATCNQTTGNPGVFPIRTTRGDTYAVTPGENYSFKVLGYQSSGSSASLYVWSNNGDILWPGVTLPQGQANENWASASFVIPAGATQIKIGVLWSSPATGNKIFINRVALYKTDFEYQYYLNDHLGSTRVVLQTNPNVITYTATMETENRSSEDMTTYPSTGQFQNMNNSQEFVFAPANSTPGGNEVFRMNAAFKIGPAKSLKVYPGDKIDASVFTYFPSGGSYSKTPTATIAGLVSTVFGGVSGAVGDPGSIFNGVNGAYVGALGLSPDQGTATPSAFLNYILFDKDYKPIGGKSVPVPSSAAGALKMIQIPQVNIQELGYIYVYLSYDNDTGNDVYFDDLKITQTESPVIQVNSYYPYGMVASSWLRTGETDNAMLYQGKELIAQTGWSDFGSRMYWADIARWAGTDPKNQFASPFEAMGNNPLLFVDPNGENALTIIIEIVVLVVVAILTDGVGDALVGEELLGSELAADAAAGAIDGAITGAIVGATSSALAGNSPLDAKFWSDTGWGAVAGAVAGAADKFFDGVSALKVGDDEKVLNSVWKNSVRVGGKGVVGGYANGFTNEMKATGDVGRANHRGIIEGIIGGEFGLVAGASEGLFQGLRISSGKSAGDKRLKRDENIFVTWKKSRTAGANGALQKVTFLRLFNAKFFEGNMTGMGIGKAVEGSEHLLSEKMLLRLRTKWNIWKLD